MTSNEWLSIIAKHVEKITEEFSDKGHNVHYIAVVARIDGRVVTASPHSYGHTLGLLISGANVMLENGPVEIAE